MEWTEVMAIGKPVKLRTNTVHLGAISKVCRDRGMEEKMAVADFGGCAQGMIRPLFR